MNQPGHIDIPHGNEVTTEPQRLALEAMSRDLVHKLNAMVAEQEQRAINERLAYIAAHIHEQLEVRIKYFVPDEHKLGGAIVGISGKVEKISATNGTIVMADGSFVSIKDLIDISGKILL